MTKLIEPEILPNVTKETILNQLSQRQDIRDYISNLTGNSYYQKELYQELFLALCEMNEDKLIELYKGKLNGYIASTLNKMFKSKSSPFYKKIKSFQNNNPDNHIIEFALSDIDFSTETKHLYLDQIQIAIDNLSYYNKNILTDYINLGFSIKKVSEKVRLTPNHISECLNETKKMLKKAILKQIRMIEENKY